MFRGEKIEAIKLFREAMSCGLAEAKDAVERMETELRQSHPERFQRPVSRGCGSMLLAGGIGLIIIATLSYSRL
ncbi:MAG: hypothetical protein FJ405_10420 [Verrucomicrobia bacterium]|nr:hypothetical protein [Verrucomicrobiota bacterium]